MVHIGLPYMSKDQSNVDFMSWDIKDKNSEMKKITFWTTFSFI